MHQQHTTDRDDRRPLAGTDAASAPPCSGFTLHDGTWVSGATRSAAARTASPVPDVF